MSMQGEERLARLNKPADSDTSDMQIEWGMIHHPAVIVAAVEIGVIGRGVEEHYGLLQIFIADKVCEISRDS